MANPGSQQAVDEAAKLGDIGFPEFTAKLVNDTFDAMVASMVRQEQSYADLLEKAAMTLDEFASETVPDSQVHSWLDSNLGTDNDDKNPVEQGALSQDQVKTIAEALKGSVPEDKLTNLPGVQKDSGSLKYSKAQNLSDDDKKTIRNLVRRAVAQPRLNALEELVEKGVVRVAVDDGTIHTDLDFHTSGSNSESHRSHHSEHNTSSAHVDGGFVGEMFGISGGASTKNVYVSSRHSKQTSQASSDVDIQGHVKVNFRGDFEPLRQSDQGDQSGGDGSN